MKRVRYLAGAVGLAPAAALGLATPAAHPAPARRAAAPGKTVSLRTTGVTPDAGCGGKDGFTAPRDRDIKLHGWFTPHPLHSKVCIGEVIVSVFFARPGRKSMTMSLRGSRDKTIWGPQNRRLHDPKSGWLKTGFGVHKSFGGLFFVGAAVTPGSATSISFSGD